MKKIFDVIKRYGWAGGTGYMTYDSWKDGKRAMLQQAILEDKELKIDSAEKARELAEDKFNLFEIKFKSSYDRFETARNTASEYLKKIEELKDSKDQADLAKLKTYKELWEKAQKSCDSELSSLQKAFEKSDSEIIKSDMSDIFNNFVENYKEFLTTISSEQKVILLNIICFIVLLFTLTNISTVLIGDSLIKLFKLETNYPKLANFIKIRKKINEGYLVFNIIIFYILIFFAIILNIYMFYLNM